MALFPPSSRRPSASQEYSAAVEVAFDRAIRSKNQENNGKNRNAGRKIKKLSRKSINLEEKLEVVNCFENGERQSDIARKFKLTMSYSE
jgi:hypothetical protein